jgi:hypothetical protein
VRVELAPGKSFWGTCAQLPNTWAATKGLSWGSLTPEVCADRKIQLKIKKMKFRKNGGKIGN